MQQGQTVAKNTLFLTIGSVVQKLLAFVYFTALARYFLPPEEIGKYLYALSYVALFSVIVDFGMQPTLIREIAKNKERTKEIVANALGIKMLLAAGTALAMLAAVRLTDNDPIKIMLISIAAITLVLDSVQLTFYAVLRGHERLNYEAVGVLVGQGITVAAGIVILLLRAPLPLLMFSFVAGSFWNVSFSYAKTRRVASVGLRPRFDKTIWKELLRLALPFAVAAVFVRIYSSADSVLVNKIAGNVAAAFYGVPYKFVFAFQFIPIALAAALYPALSREVGENKQRAGDLFAASERYLMLIVFPLVAGMIVLAKPIIVAFYRDQYLPAVPIMAILAWCLIPSFLDFPVGALLNAARRQNIQTALMGIVMALNIAINILLVPVYGGLGAAAAALAGNSVLFLGGLIYAFRIVSIPWKKLLFSFARIGVSSAAMAAVVLLSKNAAPLYYSVAIGVLVYLGALFATREVGRTDLLRLRDLLSRPKPEHMESGPSI